MASESINCTKYENCAGKAMIRINMQENPTLGVIAVGCWGTYCQDGDYTIISHKKKEFQVSHVYRGQKRVAKALIDYTQKHKITDMYLAGDNVYQVAIRKSSQSIQDDYLKEKQRLFKELTGTSPDPLQNFDMDKQISEGFQDCFMKARVQRFFLAIGNHDIENCTVLNKQYNYKRWNIPSLYYNVVYTMKNYRINFIVLDTNMFEDEPVDCSGKHFEEKQIQTQEEWAKTVSKKGDWNIVIGHIPYYSTGHKAKRPIVRRERLAKLIDTINPQVYICADEHNQQFIHDGKRYIIVAGSGGTDLDPFEGGQIAEKTLYASSSFGFVVYNFSENQLKVTFISAFENKYEIGYTDVIKR